MSTTPFTLIDQGQPHQIDATTKGSTLRLATEPLLEALGWTQKTEGLCQGDICIPIANRPDLITQDGVDLVALGELLGRPIALDSDESTASIGEETAANTTLLADGIAPDFTLPDLSGKQHTLSSFRGKKVLLIAYASW
jgi:hypothetical protein